MSNRDKLRLMIGDNNKLMVSDKFGVGDGSNKYFKISMFPIRSATEILIRNSTSLTRDTDYTIDNAIGLITMTSAPSSGEALQASKYEYNAFSDSELDQILSDYGNNLNMSAAHCCRALAVESSRWFSYYSGDEKIDKTKCATHFREMVKMFEEKSSSEQAGQIDIGILRTEIYDEDDVDSLLN